MKSFEYRSEVLQSKDDEKEEERLLNKICADGWELVAVVRKEFWDNAEREYACRFGGAYSVFYFKREGNQQVTHV